MHGTLFFLFGPDNCSVVAQHLTEIYSSALDAERNSRVNLLAEDEDGRCCGDLLWAIDKPDLEEDLCSPTQALVTHLCALKRSGLDVSDYIQKVLGHDRGYRALCGISYPPVAVRLAQHGRELSPEWWETTKAQLIAMHQVTGDGTTPPTAAAFVERVDSLGFCTDCPPNLPFQASSTNSIATKLGGAKGLPVHALRMGILPTFFKQRSDRLITPSVAGSNHPGFEVQV